MHGRGPLPVGCPARRTSQAEIVACGPETGRRPPRILLRPALVEEQGTLEELQRRASLGNPGDRAAILANPDAVEVPLEQLTAGCVYVAEMEGSIAGFAAVVPREGGGSELDALFVEPGLWGKGVGRALVEHCCTVARMGGSASLYVLGNPHAEGFYEAWGFEVEGRAETRFGVGLLMRRALGSGVREVVE